MFGPNLTEDQIERTVERRMDVLDRAYMRGDIDEAAYDALVVELDQWAYDQQTKQPVER